MISYESKLDFVISLPFHITYFPEINNIFFQWIIENKMFKEYQWLCFRRNTKHIDLKHEGTTIFLKSILKCHIYMRDNVFYIYLHITYDNGLCHVLLLFVALHKGNK